MTDNPKVMCSKCLDVIQSTEVHDFQRCNCGAIAIDGGSSYTRCLGNPDDFIWDAEAWRDSIASLKEEWPE